MLEMAAKEMNKSLDEAYEEAGYKLQEVFGSLYKGFKTSLTKPTALLEKGIPESWAVRITKIAEKSIEQKEFVFRAGLNIRTHRRGGIFAIKNVLQKAEDMGLEVRYISAPEYLVKYRTKNAKKGLKEFSEKLEELAKAKDVEASFKIAK